MKKLLIIRSAALQQLDKNLSEIIAYFPNYEISLLTHEHSANLSGKYSLIKNVYVYPFKEAFKKGNKVPDIENKVFDAVLVLATNESGAGFLNVLEFATSIQAEKYYMCNLVSEIWEVNKQDIKKQIWKGKIMKGLASLITSFIYIPLSFFLSRKLKQMEKKG